MRKGLFFFLSTTCCFTAFADQGDQGEVALIEPDIYLLTRADSLPRENMEEVSDAYLEGYIQSLVDTHYYEHRVTVIVKDHNVTLYNLPHNDLLSNSITGFVMGVPGVKSVEVKKDVPPAEQDKLKGMEPPRVEGVWFPQSTVLFQPLIADPREPMYYVAFRGGDHIVGNVAIAVAMGDEFPIFRWRDIWTWQGDLQIGISAGIWAVFNFSDVPHKKNHEVSELINTDYLVGIPLTYAVDRWSFRLRVYHISGHLGDEFIVNHPWYINKRKNPSFEAVDFFTAYQFNRYVRGYIGPGFILHSDRSFRLQRLYIEYGFEARMFGRKIGYHRLYGTPFFALHVENWQVRHWGFDVTAKLGYELSKLQGIGRKMRIYVDYHNGYSYEGQFFKKRTQYGEVGLSWGW
jgi:hypothetical protein